MVNGNDLLEFEESYYETLVEEFISRNQELWSDFVEEEFMNQDYEV